MRPGGHPPLASAYGGQNGDGAVVRSRCVESFGVACVLVVNENVYMRAKLTLFGDHTVDDTRIFARKDRQYVAH